MALLASQYVHRVNQHAPQSQRVLEVAHSCCTIQSATIIIHCRHAATTSALKCSVCGVPTGRIYLALSLQWLHDLELTLLTVVQDAARSLEVDNDDGLHAELGCTTGTPGVISERP